MVPQEPPLTAADIRSAPIRYIKLGPGGLWAQRALEQGEVHLGHSEVPHELALAADKSSIIAHLVAAGRSPGKATDFAREITQFYKLPAETIWVTLENGSLWWTRACTDVEWLGAGERHGARIRRTREPWRNTDLKNRQLNADSLSTKLTRTAAYRQTICNIAAEDYLRLKLIGEESPLISEAIRARRAVVESAKNLICELHWADFETLVDLILARGGWHRISALGGTVKDADLVMEQAVTGETATVQVKSSATQSVLNDYIARFDANQQNFTRLIFACHSPRSELTAQGRDDVTVWGRQGLAEAAICNGLFDWLLARAG